MIKLIKQFWLFALIIIPLIIILIIRNTGTGRFRYDAGKLAEPSFSGSNLITPEKAGLPGKKSLIIIFDKEDPGFIPEKGHILRITADSVLSPVNRKIITGSNGPVLLYSSDYSLSARVWMVLNQSGYKNVFILVEDQGNETGKEKFRPDKVNKPES